MPESKYSTPQIGLVAGRWTVLGYSHSVLYPSQKSARHFWLCECSCGIVRPVQAVYLLSGMSLGCGRTYVHRPDDRKCVVCGSSLREKPKAVNCCSMECRNEFYRGENSHKYKGGFTDQRGYRVIRVEGVPTKEHRHIMEQYLGRPLLETEVIHHKNGNKADNRIENLELIESQAKHMSEHCKHIRTEAEWQCSKCKQIKTRDDFYPLNISWCKECCKAEGRRQHQRRRQLKLQAAA